MASINALFTPRRALFDLVLTRYLGEKRARRLASDAPEVASARTSQDLHFSNSSLGESINHSCIKTCTFRISRKVTGWDSADDQTANRSQREALVHRLSILFPSTLVDCVTTFHSKKVQKDTSRCSTFPKITKSRCGINYQHPRDNILHNLIFTLDTADRVTLTATIHSKIFDYFTALSPQNSSKSPSQPFTHF
jgi:hypothetical protein